MTHKESMCKRKWVCLGELLMGARLAGAPSAEHAGHLLSCFNVSRLDLMLVMSQLINPTCYRDIYSNLRNL